MHGGVAVPPTVDKITQALALIDDIHDFVNRYMLPDTELISTCYNDYYHIGETDGRFLSFGLFRFGNKNEQMLWKSGVLDDGIVTQPQLELIREDIARAWFERAKWLDDGEIRPAPYKSGAYTWTKAVLYQGLHHEGGPLARMTINGLYNGGTSTMDRIAARTLETLLITELIKEWLCKLKAGPAPICQKKELVRNQAISVTDAMRGALLHCAQLQGEKVEKYDIITPTVWNFSPKDEYGNRGPAETALIGTEIPSSELKFVIPGRIIRSFDPCISCATHILDARNPFIANVNKQLSADELVQALRTDIIGEYEAIISYEAHAISSQDQRVKQALQKIADEERKHVGQLEELLALLNPKEGQLIQQGKQVIQNQNTAQNMQAGSTVNNQITQ
ncbi:MAG: nickel-dependent hydrogenase large subunit [Firmicutes bacterium]|nr:nickel-dependent hydrogenase large subunit [Bacillota bacterium]